MDSETSLEVNGVPLNLGFASTLVVARPVMLSKQTVLHSRSSGISFSFLPELCEVHREPAI